MEKTHTALFAISAPTYLFAKFRFIGQFEVAMHQSLLLEEKVPRRGGMVKKFRIRRNFHKNDTFSCTPHQSASLTAEGELPRRGKRGHPGVSPQGEAFATAYLTGKSEFSNCFIK